MRKVFFLTLCLWVSQNIYAKSDSLVVRNKWCARADTLVFFVEGYNMIQVYGGGIDPHDIRVKSMDGDLRFGNVEVKGDTMCAWAMPFEAGKKMRVAVVSKKNGRTIKELYCTADTIPQPQAKVGELQGFEITKKDLLNQSQLKAYYPKSLYSYPYKILHYTFKARKGQDDLTKTVESHTITLDVQKIIKDLPANTLVTFTDIIAICPECNSKRLKDIKMVVK